MVLLKVQVHLSCRAFNKVLRDDQQLMASVEVAVSSSDRCRVGVQFSCFSSLGGVSDVRLKLVATSIASL